MLFLQRPSSSYAGAVRRAQHLQVQHLSASLGWSYFAAWTLSFWPQVLENARRRSVDGLSLDYLVLSIIGYACYTAYTAALYFSPGVREAYMAGHGGAASDVQLADVLFAGHALAVSLLTLGQCRAFAIPRAERSDTRAGSPEPPPAAAVQLSPACSTLAVGVVVVIIAQLPLVQRAWCSATSPIAATAAAAATTVVAAALGTDGGDGMSAAVNGPAAAAAAIAAAAAANGAAASAAAADDCMLAAASSWLPLLYQLGGIKVLMTLIKYTPQAVLNAGRRSTRGWTISNVLLDIAGGLLSLAQVGVDTAARNDWSVVLGNPAKLGIGTISIAFDLLFILQHYVLYRSSWDGSGAADGGGANSRGTAPRKALQLARVRVGGGSDSAALPPRRSGM